MKVQVGSGCYGPGSDDPQPYVMLRWGTPKSGDRRETGVLEFRLLPREAQALARRLTAEVNLASELAGWK